MNRKARRLRQIDQPEVNLTPLIDVVFVILIMFILVAPILELDQIELATANQTKEISHSVQETGPIVIHVQKDNTITFNNQKVSIGQLPKLFKQAKQRYPKAKPQIYHDRRGEFGTYQTIKNAAEMAGFEQMDVILKPN